MSREEILKLIKIKHEELMDQAKTHKIENEFDKLLKIESCDQSISQNSKSNCESNIYKELDGYIYLMMLLEEENVTTLSLRKC